MTLFSMDSTPTIVSCTSTPVVTPPPSQSISLPSSNRSNSNGVDKNPCFSLDDRNGRTSFNARNDEETPIESTPSSFATQIEPTFCNFTDGPSSSSSSSVEMGGNSSVFWGTCLIILILPTCWIRGTHLPPTMGQFPATWSISLLRIQQIAKVLYSNWWMACLTKRRWPVLVWLGVSESIEEKYNT